MPRIIILGTVQGVGFRPTVYRVARKLGLKGHVLNRGSEVEVVIDGDAGAFMSELEAALPPLARVSGHRVEPCPAPAEEFHIVPSTNGPRTSPVPPDSAICPDCLAELSQAGGRRSMYPFINCTNCDARFSVIDDMPYDRPKTSMADFPMCSACAREYSDPLDRRFHAQTTSCPDCGPRYRVEGVPANDPVGLFASAIDAGKIGAVKSWGGTHVVCLPSQASELRKRFSRPQKPLAVMVRDLEAARRYTHVSASDAELLASPARPIVLLEHAGKGLEDTAPGLDRIGLYLPYSGLHHALFSKLGTDALIMTSGNTPGEPMAITDDEILRLGVDIFLLHNRRIINRTDDSVVIPHANSRFFVRKSRGHVPNPLPVGHSRTLVAVGADMNNTGGISVSGKAVLTQHIGDISRYETSLFLESAIRHLMKLYGVERPEAVITDMHPRYSSRGVGRRLAEEWGVPAIEVQHHAAHAFALAAERDLDELTVLACDGTGYGADKQAWGGEVISLNAGNWDRKGHLAYIPLLGGDKAVEDPRRMVFAVCGMLGIDQPYFTGGEAEILHGMMKSSAGTSSTGRVLDALSCWLGICDAMTYDGEPAMKLERYIARGRPAFRFHADVKAGVVDTPGLFAQLADECKPGGRVGQKKAADLARSFAQALMEGLVSASGRQEALGFTGGVSYNLALNGILESICSGSGTKLITHENVPNGDGGISFGQLAGGGLHLSGDSR